MAAILGLIYLACFLTSLCCAAGFVIALIVSDIHEARCAILYSAIFLLASLFLVLI